MASTMVIVKTLIKLTRKESEDPTRELLQEIQIMKLKRKLMPK